QACAGLGRPEQRRAAVLEVAVAQRVERLLVATREAAREGGREGPVCEVERDVGHAIALATDALSDGNALLGVVAALEVGGGEERAVLAYVLEKRGRR